MNRATHIAFWIKAVPGPTITPALLELADRAAKQEILSLLAQAEDPSKGVIDILKIDMIWVLTDAQGDMQNKVLHRYPVVVEIASASPAAAPEILILDPGSMSETNTHRPAIVHQVFIGIGDPREEGLKESNPLAYGLDLAFDPTLPEQERTEKLTELGILKPGEKWPISYEKVL